MGGVYEGVDLCGEIKSIHGGKAISSFFLIQGQIAWELQCFPFNRSSLHFDVFHNSDKWQLKRRGENVINLYTFKDS